MNVWTGSGRIASDVEVKYTQQGKVVTKFLIACQRWNDKDNADFIRCVAFGKTAETIGNYICKGQRILVTNGTIHTGKYENQDGKTVYTTEVWVNGFEFIDKGKAEGGAADKGFESMGKSQPDTTEDW